MMMAVAGEKGFFGGKYGHAVQDFVKRCATAIYSTTGQRGEVEFQCVPHILCCCLDNPPLD